MASKKISLSAEADLTTLTVQVTGAPGGAGVAVAYSTASSAVVLTNISSIATLQYKIDAGAWTDLTRQSGIALPINFATSTLYLRRSSLEGGDEYAHLAIEAVPTLKAGLVPVAIGGGGGGAGTPGADGKTILNGTGAPSSGIGNNGDFYIDTAANILYGPKAGGAWPGTGVSMSASAAGPDVQPTATASFTLTATHVDQTIPVNSTSAVVATIPTHATAPLRIGAIVTLVRKGSGGVSFQPASGVTLGYSRSSAAYAVGSTISVKKLDTNDWQVIGGEQL